mgnify:CR=1 FL=1
MEMDNTPINSYLISDILLYAKCPMLAFFKINLGMNDENSSIKGQLGKSLSLAINTYISNINSSNAYSLASRIFGIELSKMKQDSSTRGNLKKKKTLSETTDSYYRSLERCVSEIKDMDISNAVSPWVYSLTINNNKHGDRHTYSDLIGEINAKFIRNNKTHLMFFDTNTTAPSDDYLNNGINITLNALAYREIELDNDFILLHYWLLGDTMYEVNRTPEQITTVKKEILKMKEMMVVCKDGNYWYRNKGYWCNNCACQYPCNEISASFQPS